MGVFFGWNLVGFWPEKCDFELYKGYISYGKKNGPNICQISKECFSNLPDFYDKFQSVAKIIEGFWFLPPPTFIFSV
jgi:hypothetical protein